MSIDVGIDRGMRIVGGIDKRIDEQINRQRDFYLSIYLNRCFIDRRMGIDGGIDRIG